MSNPQEWFQFRYNGEPAAPRRPTWHDAAKDGIGEEAFMWDGLGQMAVKVIQAGHTLIWKRQGHVETVCLQEPSMKRVHDKLSDEEMKRRLIASIPGNTPKPVAPVLQFATLAAGPTYAKGPADWKHAQVAAYSHGEGPVAGFRGVSTPAYADRAHVALTRTLDQMRTQAEAMLALYLQKNPQADLLDIQIVTRTAPDGKSIRMFLEKKDA